MPVLQDGQLVLYGFVGSNFWDEGFTSQEVMAALAEVGRDTDVTVRINSGGGYADEGVAIYNALAAHKGRVRVEVDSVAASAASLIAMAGDEVVMKAGSRMMIHDPSAITLGTAEDHRKTIDYLDRTGASMASIYAERAEKKADAVREEMRAETWMTAEEAVDAGYADKVETGRAKAAAPFDYRIYANAPLALRALSEAKGWSIADVRRRATAQATHPAAPPAPTGQQEVPMTEKTAADNHAAEIVKATAEAAAKAVADFKARRQAIMSSEHAKGREALAEHLADDTDMPVDKALAVLAKAPAGTAPKAEETPEAQAERRAAAAGLAAPAPSATAKIDDVWKRAVARSNAGR